MIFQEIIDERIRQDRKWGDQSYNSPMVWTAVLGEEFGEVAKAAIEYRFRDASIDDLHKELIQVAAVAVAWVEAIDVGHQGNKTRD